MDTKKWASVGLAFMDGCMIALVVTLAAGIPVDKDSWYILALGVLKAGFRAARDRL